jgi:hypothetical protein
LVKPVHKGRIPPNASTPFRPDICGKGLWDSVSWLVPPLPRPQTHAACSQLQSGCHWADPLVTCFSSRLGHSSDGSSGHQAKGHFKVPLLVRLSPPRCSQLAGLEDWWEQDAWHTGGCQACRQFISETGMRDQTERSRQWQVGLEGRTACLLSFSVLPTLFPSLVLFPYFLEVKHESETGL